MVRIARVVAPGIPHHITQRGNRKQQTFFSDNDYAIYIDLMSEWCRAHSVDIWAYCLMPNHIHLIAVPPKKESLRLAIGEAHRRYTNRINLREGWKGYLWQGRFASYVLDEPYLLACVRYIEMNPVKAGLTKEPAKWPWSSAAAHIIKKNDKLVKVEPLLSIINEDWSNFLTEKVTSDEREKLRKHERTGRPLGSLAFIEQLEKSLCLKLKPAKLGRKFKDKNLNGSPENR